MATSTSTTTAVAGTGNLAPSIPQVQIKFLNSDGTVSLPWYRFLQSLTGNQSGVITNVSAVTTTVSEVVTTVSAVSSTANEALALAQSNELLGFVGLSDGAMQGALSLTLGELLAVSQGNAAQPPNEAQALALAALGQLPPLDRSGAPYSPRPKPDLSFSALDAESIRALVASAQITSRVRSLNFGSNLTATSDHAGNVSLSATGGGSNLEVIANGTTLTTAATVLTFTGAGVAGSVSGTDATLTIPGASGALAAVSCSLSGTTITVDRSTNVASVTRTAAGRYRLTFTTALSISTYGVAAIGQYPTESGVLPIAGIDATSGYGATTTTLDIAFETAAGVFADLAYFTVLVFDPANFTGGGESATVPFTPPLQAAWSWLYQYSGATKTDASGALALYSPNSGSGYNLSVIVQAAPSTPYTRWFGLNVGGGDLADYIAAGIAVADSSGKMVVFYRTSNQFLNPQSASYPGPGLILESATNNTTEGTSIAQLSQSFPAYLGVEDDGTNLTFFYSYDGVSSFQMGQISRTAYLSSPSQIGMLVSARNATGALSTTVNFFHFGATLPYA